MSAPGKFLLKTAAIAGLLIAIGGCDGAVYEDGGPEPVYGDFGASATYVYGAPYYGEGGVYVHPPYDRGGGGDVHRAPEPEHGPAPAGHAPSIPNQPRPEAAHSAPAPASHGGGGGGGGGKRDH